MPAEVLTRFGYPKSPGDTPWSVADITGPQSYVQITPGDSGPPITPPSGGQPVFPSDFALQSIHIAVGMASNDGKYAVQIIPLPSIPMGDGTFSQLLLMWIDLSSGQQVSSGQDLSKSTVRLLAIGN